MGGRDQLPVVMGVWLWQSGIPLPFVPLLLFGAFVGFMTIARVVAQGGVASMFPPTNGPDFVVANVGGTVLGTKGMAGMALSYAWSVDTLILLMSACANGLKLVTEISLPHRRRLFGAIVRSDHPDAGLRRRLNPLSKLSSTGPLICRDFILIMSRNIPIGSWRKVFSIHSIRGRVRGRTSALARRSWAG